MSISSSGQNKIFSPCSGFPCSPSCALWNICPAHGNNMGIMLMRWLIMQAISRIVVTPDGLDFNYPTIYFVSCLEIVVSWTFSLPPALWTFLLSYNWLLMSVRCSYLGLTSCLMHNFSFYHLILIFIHSRPI